MPISLEDFASLDKDSTVENEPTNTRPVSLNEFMGVKSHGDGKTEAPVVNDPKDPLSDTPAPYRSLMAGLSNFNASIARSPGFLSAVAYDVAALPQNAIAKMTGWNIGAKAPDWMADNPLARYYDRSSEAYSYVRNEYKGEDLQSLWAKGDHIKTADYLVNSAIESSIYSLTSVAGTMVGIPPATILGTLATSQGASNYKEAREKGLNEFNAMTVSVANGSAEAVFESMGTLGLLKWGRGVIKDVGPKTAKAIFKNTFKVILGSQIGEANEEFWTQLTQDFNSKAAGLEDIPFNQFLPRAIEAGLTAFISAGATTGPGGVVAGFNDIRQENRAKEMLSKLNTELGKDTGEKGIPFVPRGTGILVGVAPYKNVSFDTLSEVKQKFEDTEFVHFENDSKEIAKGYNLTVKDETPSVGGWYDTDLKEVVFEPSIRINMESDIDTAEAYASRLGQLRNQQAIYIADLDNSTGNGIEYVLDFESDVSAFDASKRLSEFGITGFNIVGNQVFIGDQDGSLENNVKEFRNDQSEQIRNIGKRKADIRFIEQKDYNSRIEKVTPRDPVDRRVRSFDSTIANPSKEISAQEIEDSRLTNKPHQKDVIKEFDAVYTPNTNLKDKDAKVQNRIASKIRRVGIELFDSYYASYGNEINVDNARELFRDVGYDGINADATHEPVSAFMKAYRKVFLDEVEASDNKTALVLGGGSGAGKRSVIGKVGVDKSKYGVVFDGTLANKKSSIDLIQNLLDRGIKVDLIYVHRDATESWNNGVLNRVTGPGLRVVPLKIHTNQHINAPQSLKAITDTFGERVQRYSYLRNNTDKTVVPITLKDVTDSKIDIEKMQAEAINATEQKYREGKISRRVRDGLLESFRSEARGRDRGDARGIEEERRRGINPNAKGKEVKRIVLRTTGQIREDETRVKEAVALRASLRSQERLSKQLDKQAKQKNKKAFKEGRETGKSEVKSAKQILDRRRRMIRLIQNEYGLSDQNLKRLGNRDIRLMTNYEFHLYLNKIDALAVDMQKRRDLKLSILSELHEKELVKVDNLRKYLKFPSLDNMTIEQLNIFNQELESTQKGDEFLSVRKLETVKNTELKGIKTVREAREILAKKLRVDLKDVENIDVSPLDKFRYDTILAEQNPFYQFLVDETNASIINSEQQFIEMEREIDNLVRKARNSRKRSLAEKAIPSDKLVFQYLEAKDKKPLAQKMTNEELALASYLQMRFSEFRNHLIQQGVLKKYRSDYITHIRRGFLETWKEDGILNAFKEVMEQHQEDEAVFKIMEDDTQNILPLEKFFQFSMRRTGEIKPSQNVAKAFKAYAKSFMKKQALDKLVPALDIYAYSLSPKGLTPRGLQMDRRLIKFVREWINNKKGRKSSLGGILPQGGKVDVGLRLIDAFITLKDLALNIPVGITVNIGEQVTTHQNLGTKNYIKGIARSKTKKGKQIIKQSEGLVGKSTWEDLTDTADNIADTFSKGLFSLFTISNRSANEIHLLGSMTDAEFESGKISDERKAIIKREMGRYRNIPGSKSIFGSTSTGSALSKYKTWALPILNTVIKDISTVTKIINQDGITKASKSREFQEILRGVLTMTFFALAGKMLVGDDDDDSFLGEVSKKAARESLTLLGALDPTVLSSVRLLTFLGDLSVALKQIVLLEEYKTKSGYKGVTKLKSTLVPRVITKAIKDDDTGGAF